MDNIRIDLEISRPFYRRYRMYIDTICRGRLVLECYNNIWNLELMDVYPPGKGYGTIFLAKVLSAENLKAEHMTVCPISSDSTRFFKRNGFKVSDRWDQ